MDSTASRWFVRLNIESDWELVQARLLDFPVEAVVEGGAEACVYFSSRGDAESFAAELAPGEAAEREMGDNPVCVFGADGHPTTLLCLQLMDTLPLHGLHVADIGSGTGVLAAEAQRRGALVRAAVDFDAPAALATRQTVGPVAVQGGPECLAAGAFDAVLVNLHLSALRAVWPELVRLGARILVLSGLLERQFTEIETLASESGWLCRARLQREGWIGLVFSRAGTATFSSAWPNG